MTDGPFVESKELIGGFALIQAGSKQEAIDYAKRFLKIAGDGESEVRQVFDGAVTSESSNSEKRVVDLMVLDYASACWIQPR